MKQAADKFTRDVFEKPRRGRPPSLGAKTNAQRQAAYKARQRRAESSTDPRVMAAFQSKELSKIAIRLLAFSADWGDVDEYLRNLLEVSSFNVARITEELGGIYLTSGSHDFDTDQGT